MSLLRMMDKLLPAEPEVLPAQLLLPSQEGSLLRLPIHIIRIIKQPLKVLGHPFGNG